MSLSQQQQQQQQNSVHLFKKTKRSGGLHRMNQQTEVILLHFMTKPYTCLFNRNNAMNPANYCLLTGKLTNKQRKKTLCNAGAFKVLPV